MIASFPMSSPLQRFHATLKKYIPNSNVTVECIVVTRQGIDEVYCLIPHDEQGHWARLKLRLDRVVAGGFPVEVMASNQILEASCSSLRLKVSDLERFLPLLD